MLTWKETLTQEELNERRYMEIERDRSKRHVIGRPAKNSDSTINEYKERPVLPTPLQIMNIEDDRQRPNQAQPHREQPIKRRDSRNGRSQNQRKSSNKGHPGSGGFSATFKRGPKPPKR